jgi:hypothetical protein
MMSPLLLHQVVDGIHGERIASRRAGRAVVARTVAHLHQVVWRSTALVTTAHGSRLPSWLERLRDCVDEPSISLVGAPGQGSHPDHVHEECRTV